MAVAAEAHQWGLVETVAPEVMAAADRQVRSFLGSIMLSGNVELINEPNSSTLLAATQGAALGDEAAERAVNNNVSSDVAERLFKVANIAKSKLRFIGAQLFQENTSLANINRNTFQHTVLIPEMYRRGTLEARNVFIFENLKDQGWLEDYDALVFSPSSTTMTDRQKQQYGLFVDTETCSIQLLRTHGDDVELQSAFVAGKARPEDRRHDIATIRNLLGDQGVEVPIAGGTDMLGHVVLVPKQSLPNGVSDVVKLYDAINGTFFGQAQPRQDYQEYAQFCEQRSERYGHIVERVAAQLIAEAHSFQTPFEAILRLDQLSSIYCVEYAGIDKTIDAAVFGPQAAVHVADVRAYMAMGQPELAEQSLEKARQADTSSSCPLFKGAASDASDGLGNSNTAESSGKKNMNCPFCKAKVFDDPCAAILSCWDCKALVVNGKLKSSGNGGSRARSKEREQLTPPNKKPRRVEQQRSVGAQAYALAT